MQGTGQGLVSSVRRITDTRQGQNQDNQERRIRKDVLSLIQDALRRGTLPSEIRSARSLGRGCQREAWRVGDYVVKANTPAYRDSDAPTVATRSRTIPRKVLRACGIQPPQRWYVGLWVIEPFYRTLTYGAFAKRVGAVTKQGPRAGFPVNAQGYDLSAANCGVDAQGVLHAFDW